MLWSWALSTLSWTRPVSSPGGPGACQTRSRLGQASNIGTQTEETNIIRVRVFPPVGRIINEERSVGFHTVKYWHVENSINILFVTKVSVLCAMCINLLFSNILDICMHCIAWYKMVNRYFNLLALNFPHRNAIMLDYFDILIAPFLAAKAAQ